MKHFSIALLAMLLGFSLHPARAGVLVSVGIPPPPLPVYQQPLCPGPGYIWTPGYWAYGDPGYYWVEGTWEVPPTPGFLWTPGYWGWTGTIFLWHGGYWGRHVGFYGGVNYGYGYPGRGYRGERWGGNHFTANNPHGFAGPRPPGGGFHGGGHGHR